MEQKNKNVSARITFKADKMLPKMKKALTSTKGEPQEWKHYPAVEMETGVMVATDAKVLAAHKLQDYSFEPSDGAVLGYTVMLPAEVLSMTGTIEVTVAVDGNSTVTTARDENGAAATLRSDRSYPNWRSAVPKSGGVIDIDAASWDGALKDLVKAIGKENKLYPIHVSGQKGDMAMKMVYTNLDTGTTAKRNATIGGMLFKVSVSLNAKRLRDIMTFQPTTMRFAASMRAVLFTNDSTLAMLMPMLINDDDERCEVDCACREQFDLDKWIGADLGEVVVDNSKDAPKAKATPKAVKPETSAVPKPEPKPELSFAERLRAILLAQDMMKKAA